jgi:hypothetical protein
MPPIELQGWTKKDSVEYHFVTSDGTDLGTVSDAEIGQELTALLNAAIALRPQDWKLSDANVNSMLAANQKLGSMPLHGIDIVDDNGRTHFGAVIVCGDHALAELILTAVNALRETTERITSPEFLWVREAGGSLSIIDGQGRHIAELQSTYWNGKEVAHWTDSEIAQHAARICRSTQESLPVCRYCQQPDCNSVTCTHDKEGRRK